MKALLSSTSNSKNLGKRTLIACGLALLLCVVVDVTLGLTLPDGNKDKRFVRERLSENKAPTIQILGDSVVRSGVLASALSYGEIVARNDGVAGGAPPFSYLIVKQEVAQRKKPKAIVISHSPHTFSAARNSVLIGTFAYWREVPELMLAADSWGDIAYGAIARLSYLLSNRDYIRLMLARGDADFLIDAGDDAQEVPPDVERIARRRSHVGSMNSSGSLPDVLDSRYLQPFAVSPENDKLFGRMLALAKANGIKVYWMTMPVPERIKIKRTELNYETALLTYLDKYVSKKELVMLNRESDVYPDSHFRDLSHLNETGAIRFGCDIRKYRAVIMPEIGQLKDDTDSTGMWTEVCNEISADFDHKEQG